MPAISALADVSFTAITRGVSSSSALNTIFTTFQTGINNLNDVMADLEKNYAGSAAPTDNAVRGKLWADTTSASRVVLKLDPDGLGCDDEVATRLEAKNINFATGGTATHKLMGVINVNTTSDPLTAAGDFPQDYTLPANTLDANGKALRITWWGTRSGAAGTFSLQPKLGGTNLGTAIASAAGVASLTTWMVQCLIVRTAAAAQDVFFYAVFNRDDDGSTALASFDGAKTEDFTGDLEIDLDLTAISAGTVTQEGFIVELLQ